MEEEDIDEYLYGKETAHAVKASSFVPKPEVTPKIKASSCEKVAPKHEQELSSLYTDLNEESQEETTQKENITPKADEQDEDDIEIVLDDAPEPQEKQLTSISTSKQNATSGQSGSSSAQGSRTTTQQKNLVIYGVPEYEGQSIFNIDLDTVEDKPWRKPGADITDYFNFGFDEYTWRQYCYKQKLFKDETAKSGKIQDKLLVSAPALPQQSLANISSTLPPPPPPPHHIIMSSSSKTDVPPPPITSSSMKKQVFSSKNHDRQYKSHHQDRHHQMHDSSSRSRSPSKERDRKRHRS